MAIKRWTDGSADGDWSTAGNWSPSGAPANGDDVYIESSSRDINAGLSQSAVALASLNISMGFTGTLGTSTAALEIGATSARLGYQNAGSGAQAGSNRLHIDLGSTTASTVVIEGSASSSEDSGLNPVRIKADNASTVIVVRGGQVSIADFPAETTTVSAITFVGGSGNIGQPNNNTAVTLTTLTVVGGSARTFSMPTTANVEGGTLVTEGGGAITTVNVRGGAFVSNSTGTITTLNADGGYTDLSQSSQARTITTANMKSGARLRFDPDVMTFTNKININESKAVTVSVN